ncbi:unannotated protein [freshwater metagenome]|uniref:Unannotated protein n=1 Tax=freshwater metagenome TaxID=449393 RepID=A0A6J7DGS5_9ZZZZ
MRQRAGFVECDRLSPSESLQCPCMFDDDARMCRARHSRHECDRCTNEKRAWCGNNENLCKSTGVATSPPRHARNGVGDESERHGVAIGEANKGCFRFLGLADQCNYSLILAVRRYRRGNNIDCTGSVDRTGHDGIAIDFFHREAFPRQCRFIERSRRGCQRRIDRHNFARSNKQAIANDDT